LNKSITVPISPGVSVEMGASAAPSLVEQIVYRTTLADITGTMAQAARALEDAINDPTLCAEDREAEIDAALALWNSSSEPLEAKLEAYSHVRRSWLGEEETLEREEARIAERRRRIKAKVATMDGNVEQCLAVVQKVRTPTMGVTLVTRKGDRLVIDSPLNIPPPEACPAFWKQRAPELDKSAIKAAMKEGAEIPGVHLEDSTHLRWS
jgi:hypothetical protein